MANRVVKNLIPLNAAFWNNSWNPVVSNGTASVTGNGKVLECRATIDSARIAYNRNFDFTPGERYAITCATNAVAGDIANIILFNQAVAAGNFVTINHPSGGPTRIGIVFTVGVGGSVNVRFGINPNGPDGLSGMAVDASDPMIELLIPGQTTPSEFVFPGSSAEYDYETGNTLTNNIVTEAVGVPRVASPPLMTVVVGDSQSSEIEEIANKLYIETDIPVMMHTTAGTTIAQANADWASILSTITNVSSDVTTLTAGRPLVNTIRTDSLRAPMYMIQRIINDINANGDSLDTLKARIELMISNIKSVGGRGLFWLCSPFRDDTFANGWSADKQVIVEGINAWIPVRLASEPLFDYYDDYSALEDPTPGEEGKLLPAYDKSPAFDGLHYNEAAIDFMQPSYVAKIQTLGSITTTAPTLTNPYSSLQVSVGDSGSIDFSTNISGATSFAFSQLPPWAVQVGTTGVVNYTSASWGTENSLVAIGDGLWDVQLQAINDFDTLEAAIYWRVS